MRPVTGGTILRAMRSTRHNGDPRRPVLIALRDRIIPTVSDGSDPKMTIHRALSFSDEVKFNTVLQSLLAVDANNESWYRSLSGFLVDSWNNNQATIYRYANKRYSIIFHMNKYHAAAVLMGSTSTSAQTKSPRWVSSRRAKAGWPAISPCALSAVTPK